MLDSTNQDRIFSALSDTSRRKIIELLYLGESTLLELSQEFTFSYQALSKHIKVLENARIVTKRVEGKYRILSLDKSVLKSSLSWISYHSDFWNRSFDHLEMMIKHHSDD